MQDRDTELAAEIARYKWFHSIDLGGGIVTPGAKTLDIHRIDVRLFSTRST
jgi:hypothetical protein